MTPSRKPRIIAATARIDKLPKETRARKLKQRREIEAWQNKSQRKDTQQ